MFFLQWLTSQERWTEQLYIIIMYEKMLLTAYKNGCYDHVSTCWCQNGQTEM